MPSEQAAKSDLAYHPLSTSGDELTVRIRDDLASRFAWPALLGPAAEPLRNLGGVINLGKLADVAAAVSNVGNEVSFAIISSEYIRTGLNWAHAMRRLGLNNFLMIAGDKFTSDTLDRQGFQNVLAEVDKGEFDRSFISSTGFSAKGLAVSALKFPVSLFLVKSGLSVIMSDADAVWLQDPAPYLRGADVAFQRIVYHPPSIAQLWGFAACGGFMSFRSGIGTVAFLERCLAEHRISYCDQVAINLALLDGEPEWRCEHAGWQVPATDVERKLDQLEAGFARWVRSAITGKLMVGGLRVLALPHDKFWRHGWVAASLQDMVVCHPNSPKDDQEKMKILASMSLCFDPNAPAEPEPGTG